MNNEAIISQNKVQLAQMNQKISELMLYIAKLEKMIFGPKSEKFIPTLDTNQLSLFNELADPINDKAEPQIETVTYERVKKSSLHKGRQLLSNCSHLEVEDRIIDVEHEEGDIHIGDEISERLAKKPGKLFIIRYLRRKYKKANEETIVTAAPVEEPIAKCEADVSLLADVIVSKYVDHLPEYRQIQIYKREGVCIAPSTMNGWVHQLGPYFKLMAEYIKTQILKSGYMQQDESTIRVMDGSKKSTHLGYMWVMLSKKQGYVYFEYQKGRDRSGPAANLKNYEGNLQTDAYEVYEVIDKAYAKIIHFLCWAHARRKFDESKNNDKARSEYALTQIQKLYAIERECKEAQCTPEQRLDARQASKDILVEFKKWLDAESLKVTPRSPIAIAISYLTKRWAKFVKYTDYGEVEIDNNLIENAIRPLALGRKNYLFAGNHAAATNIGHFYTVLNTCRLLTVNPYDYLVWFLTKVAYIKTSEIGILAPDAYLQTLNPKN